MARQTGGILGDVRGKISNVVGAKWKTTAYFRQLVTPANPNTESQQTVRGNMSEMVAMGKAILSPVIQPYWNDKSKKASGYNVFIGQNLVNEDVEKDFLTVKTSIGSLELGAGITVSEYDAGDGTMTVNWATATSGNGQATDKAIVVVYDTVNKVAYTSTSINRSVGTWSSTIPAGLDPTKLFSYVSFTRGTGKSLLTSPSFASAVVEP